MMKRLIIVVFALGILLTTGCATIVEGSGQNITVSTTGCDEYGNVSCHLINKDNNIVVSVPGTAYVEKGKQALSVTCRTSDNKTNGSTQIQSGYEAMNVGNILVGGIIGLAVDGMTGAMWHFPSSVNVPLKCPENN